MSAENRLLRQARKTYGNKLHKLDRSAAIEILQTLMEEQTAYVDGPKNRQVRTETLWEPDIAIPFDLALALSRLLSQKKKKRGPNTSVLQALECDRVYRQAATLKAKLIKDGTPNGVAHKKAADWASAELGKSRINISPVTINARLFGNGSK